MVRVWSFRITNKKGCQELNIIIDPLIHIECYRCESRVHRIMLKTFTGNQHMRSAVARYGVASGYIYYIYLYKLIQVARVPRLIQL